MDALPGHTDFELLQETLGSVLYKAVRTETRERVIIKVLKVDRPSPSKTARFKHEYDLIRAMDTGGIVKVLDILTAQDRFILVLEDFEGAPLKATFSFPITIDRFLGVAIQLARIVQTLHAHNLSHRGLRPDAVLFDSRDKTLKLTDFGIASEMAGLQEAVYDPDMIQGSLAYIAPEQTGRLNCGVDYRADLYSLGVIFYEMLSGGVPFMSTDPMEVIHAHIARPAVPLNKLNPGIPKTLSDIVSRLLAKTAEERYQSTQGLLSDLEQCQTLLTSDGAIPPFEIGCRDISVRFNIPQMLVGREAERRVLFNAFGQVADGAARVLLMAGKPGIGKSALINEIQKPVLASHGYFAAGKYDQLRRNVPYSAIIQAGQALAGQLLTESQARIADWRDKLQTAVGPNGKVLTDLIPDIELIIGKQPDVPELVSEEARNRFTMVLKNVIGVLADREHPLVLFLDDLQWVDPASLELMQTLTVAGDLSHFFLIGAYRDNEMSSHHPLMLTVDSMLAAGVDLTHMELEALDQKGVHQLLSNFLRCAPEKSEALAETVHAKTMGNPFFINQFIKRLYENGYLVLDPIDGWQWDPVAIPKMAVTDNVVAFMAEKLMDLPADPLDLIKTAACIGNRFDAETLAAITDRTMDAIFAIIDTLTREGLVTYRQNLYRFHHDRIHEAAYALMSPDEREQYHCRIGRLALETTPKDQLFNQLFYIADQLNKAQALITDPTERTRIADLNLMAGIKAKDATAYKAAVTYFEAGMAMLPHRAWQSYYQQTYALHMELMESQYLNRNAGAAEALFNTILANAASRIDKANAYNTITTLFLNMRTAREAADIGVQGLNLLGVQVSAQAGKAAVLKELLKVKYHLLKTHIDEVITLPPMQDPYAMACMDLLVNTGSPAYFINPNLYATLVLKGVNLCLKHGNASQAGVAFMALATIVQAVQGDYHQAYRIGEMALALNRKLENKRLAGMVQHVFTFFIRHWHRHARENLPAYREVYQLCVDAGDFVYMGYSVTAAIDVRLIIGDPLESVVEEVQKYDDLLNRVKDPFIIARHRENRQLALALMNRTRDPLSLNGDDYNETEHLAMVRGTDNRYGLCFTLLYKAKLCYLFGDNETGRRLAEELDQHIQAHIGTLVISEHTFYYSLILCALFGDASAGSRRHIKKVIRRNQRKMAGWARLCPDNFQHKHDLVAAEWLAATGRCRQALSQYHAAARGARTYDYINDLAMIQERLALFYARMNAREEARTFMTLAHESYGRWGAAAKQRDIEQRHALLAPSANKRSAGKLPGKADAYPDRSTLLDLSTVMQVSQAISCEIKLDRLLHKILHLALTNAGGQRGFLILANDGALTIEAGEEMEPKSPKQTYPVPLEQGRGISAALVNYVSRSMKPLILTNAAAQGPFVNDPHVMQARCKSMLCMPIKSKNRLLGLLYMENNLTANAFTSDRLEILGVIAAQAAISLENARLFDLATTDGLTKLHVHRYFQLLLDQEVKRSQRYDRPFTLVMIDIDNFKQFNDIYGHQTGDEVLRIVGQTMKESIRSSDIAARYGGEEIALILPETEAEQAQLVAEKIRRRVQETPIPHSEGNLQVTVSMGVATFPHHAVDKESLLRSADKALYTSKRTGKNRVTVGEKLNLGPVLSTSVH